MRGTPFIMWGRGKTPLPAVKQIGLNVTHIIRRPAG